MGIYCLRIYDFTGSNPAAAFIPVSPFFFKVIINQAIRRPLKSIICGIWPYRVFGAVKGEENLGDAFHICGTLGKISLARCLCSHSKRIVYIRLHCIDQVKLHDLISPHRAAHIIFDKQLPLGIVQQDIVQSLLAHPHVNCRLNDCLSLACPGDCQYHCIDRSRIDKVNACRTLRFIFRDIPVLVDQVGNSIIQCPARPAFSLGESPPDFYGFLAAQLILVFIAGIVTYFSDIISLSYFFWRTGRFKQGIGKLRVKHGHFLVFWVIFVIINNFTFICGNFPATVMQILIITFHHPYFPDSLITERHM